MIFRNRRFSLPPLIFCLLSILGFLLVAQVALAIVRQPSLIWNEIRWCRSLALARGQPIYLGQNDLGPIIGTLHTPVSHTFYAALIGWVGDPVQAILAGSLISVAMIFGVLGWLFVRARSHGPGAWTAASATFLFCAFAVMQSPATYAAVTLIHTDACALAFSTIACGLVFLNLNGHAKSRIWLCAACVVLSIGSKQTMLPLAVAVGVFILFADGSAAAVRYAIAILAVAAAAIGVAVALFPSGAFFFNVVTLASHQPYKSDAALQLAQAFRMAKLDSLTALFPVLFFLLHERLEPRDERLNLRPILTQCRWLVFVFAAASLVPGAIKALTTVGADINHIGSVLFFLFIASGLALQQNLMVSDHPLRRHSATLFVVVGLLVNVTPGAAFGLPEALHRLGQSDSEVAYRYALSHPKQVYFPWNPSVSLLTQGRLYHLDYALYDREIAGYPPTDRQVLSGLPRQFQYVAFPPGSSLLSRSLTQAFSRYRRTTLSELPGWTVYEKIESH